MCEQNCKLNRKNSLKGMKIGIRMVINMKEQGWIDISQPLTSDIGTWPGDTKFSYRLNYKKEETGSVNIGQFTTSVHTGTHADAPFHFDNEGKTIEELDVNIYIGRARFVDVTGYEKVGAQELEKFQLAGVTRLLFRTMNKNTPTTFPTDFTVLKEDIGPYLKEKGIFLIGTDGPSVDPIDSKKVGAHHSLHQNGVHILENLTLADVKPGDYELIALPL